MYISDTKVYYDKLIEHDLSLLEYCVADYICKLSETAGNKKDGYCYMSKENIAKAFNISERTVYRILNRLRSKSVLEKDDNCLKIINWSTKGNYYYIRHNLIAELIQAKQISLSLEEYAIMDIALNQGVIKQKELQKRINCSKKATYSLIQSINKHPNMCYIDGKFIIKDIYTKMYFDTTTRKKVDDLKERFGKLYDNLFDENGNEL